MPIDIKYFKKQSQYISAAYLVLYFFVYCKVTRKNFLIKELKCIDIRSDFLKKILLVH